MKLSARLAATLVAVPALLASACLTEPDATDEPEVGTASAAATITTILRNGVHFPNGAHFPNGVYFPNSAYAPAGTHPDGSTGAVLQNVHIRAGTLDGLTAPDPIQNGESLTGGRVIDGSLAMTSPTRGVLTNAQLAGTAMKAKLYGPSSAFIDVRIESAVQAADPTPTWWCSPTWPYACTNLSVNEHADVWRFALSAYSPSHYEWVGFSKRLVLGSWQPLCPNGARAVVTAGRWRIGQRADGLLLDLGHDETVDTSGLATFSCEDTGPIAKCVYAGYKPWKTWSRWYWRYDGITNQWQWVSKTDSGLDYLRACVRMVRADYCGNGESNTVNGTWIDPIDRMGVVGGYQSLAWGTEAEWSTDGASCVSTARIAALQPWASTTDPRYLKCRQTYERSQALIATGTACGTQDQVDAQWYTGADPGRWTLLANRSEYIAP